MIPEDQIRGLDDEHLAEVQSIVADELRSRAFDAVEPHRWTVGRLRDDLANLPAHMPLLVNVDVEVPGSEGTGFIPLVVTSAGFDVEAPGDDGETEILSIYNIQTHNDAADGTLIWVVGSRA